MERGIAELESERKNSTSFISTVERNLICSMRGIFCDENKSPNSIFTSRFTLTQTNNNIDAFGPGKTTERGLKQDVLLTSAPKYF